MKLMNAIRKKFFVMGGLLFGLIFVGMGKAQPVSAPCLEWNLATDFRTFPNQENPNRDNCGNLDVWYFLESASDTFPAHAPSTYTLLPEFITDVFFIQGLENWQGTVVSTSINNKLPAVGINNTGSTQFFINIVWPPGVMLVHPLPNAFAIVGWRSPMNGTVMITGGVNDLDNGGGNGILWSIDHFDGFTNTVLASGSIPNGGNQTFQEGVGGAQLASVIVNQGDFLYFLVDPKSMNYVFDSTGTTITIRPTTIEGRLPIDIKPRTFPNIINLRHEEEIPVAILTTTTFDATTVNSNTVLFGKTGAEAPPVSFALVDVDGDGDIDMNLHFNTSATGLLCSATSGILTGESLSGQKIRGHDSVEMVGCTR